MAASGAFATVLMVSLIFLLSQLLQFILIYVEDVPALLGFLLLLESLPSLFPDVAAPMLLLGRCWCWSWSPCLVSSLVLRASMLLLACPLLLLLLLAALLILQSQQLLALLLLLVLPPCNLLSLMLLPTSLYLR